MGSMKKYWQLSLVTVKKTNLRKGLWSKPVREFDKKLQNGAVQNGEFIKHNLCRRNCYNQGSHSHWKPGKWCACFLIKANAWTRRKNVRCHVKTTTTKNVLENIFPPFCFTVINKFQWWLHKFSCYSLYIHFVWTFSCTNL